MSHEFSVPLTCHAASAVQAKLATTLLTDGALVLDGLLGTDIVKRINAEIDPVLGDGRKGRNDTPVVSQGRRLNSALRYSSTLVERVITHPSLMLLVNEILLPHSDTVQLSATQIADIGPGESAQVLHRDDYTWGHVKGRSHPLSVVAIVALSEFSPKTGGTRVIPGSHRWDDAYTASTSGNWRGGVYLEKSYAPGAFEEIVQQPRMSPGSTLVLLGTTVHGAGHNTTTNVTRRALVIQYCVGWIRSAQNNFLLYPPAVAKTFPEDVQRLLGYQLEANHCGQLEQGVDPIITLRG